MTATLEPQRATADDEAASPRRSPPARPSLRRRGRHPLLVLAPERIAAVLLAAILAFAALSTIGRVGMLYVDGTEHGGLQEIAYRFDLDRESNITTWFSSTVLLSCGVALAVIAVFTRNARRPFAFHWALLAATFVFLSLDESAYLHEILIVPLRRRLGVGGVLYFAWVIPAFAAVAAFGLSYLRFLWHLDRRSFRLFLAAGALFVGGALGLELVGGALAEAYGLQALSYTAVMTCEEVLEMLGSGLFLYALLDYVRRHFGSWQVRLAPAPSVAAGA